jgi:hypothetical protein
VTEELILTPGGLRPRSLVHQVREGEVLRAVDGVVHRVDASLTSFLTSSHIRLRHESTAALASGWIADAFWNNGTGSSITSFTTTWAVPQPPATSSGQLIYLFNGIQNYGNNYGILQPVLQWGASPAGGGPYWAVSNWYVTSGGQAFFTPLVEVSPGDVLTGVMTLTGQSAGGFDYDSQFVGIGTTLSIQNIAELLWSNETLEAYGITQCSDYPPGGVAFTDIGIQTAAGYPSISWTAENRVTDCGQNVMVASNANPGGEVDIAFS